MEAHPGDKWIPLPAVPRRVQNLANLSSRHHSTPPPPLPLSLPLGLRWGGNHHLARPLPPTPPSPHGVDKEASSSISAWGPSPPPPVAMWFLRRTVGLEQFDYSCRPSTSTSDAPRLPCASSRKQVPWWPEGWQVPSQCAKARVGHEQEGRLGRKAETPL